MRDWIIGQGVIVYVFAGCLAIGVLSAFIANHGYKKLIRESEIMGNTQNRLLKYIKLKFGSYYKLNMKPQDTRALTRHYLYKYRIGFMNVLSWIKLSKLSAGVIGIGAVICLLWMLAQDKTAAQIISMAGCGVIASALIYIQHRLYDFPEKQNMLEWYLMDYLENFLKNKIESAQELNTAQLEKVTQDTGAPKSEGQIFNNNSRQGIHWKENGDNDHEAAASRMPEASFGKTDSTSHFARPGSETEDEIDAKIVEDILKEFLN